MRVVLVFPPQGSPTYAPLGVASLAAALRARAPDCRLDVCDLNLPAWERAAAATGRGAETLAFLRGRRPGFFDPEAYGVHRVGWEAAEARLTAWGAEVKRFLDTGGAAPELLGLLDELAARILATDPELVGFSLLSLGQLPWTLALALRLRHLGGDTARRRVVLGGAACAAFRPEDVLTACPAVDGVVVGEGEAALEALVRGAPAAAVPGLVHRSPTGVVRNRLPQTTSLKESPHPDFSGLPLERYLNPSPVVPALYSRGCKWRRCRFCAHNSSFAAYRARGAARCADELERLAELHGVRHVYFADLYVDAPDLEALADQILARGLDLDFHVLGRPTADYTPERLEKMAAAGCRWISWGVESGSQRLLEVAGKGTRVETVERVLRDAHAAGISNLMMMIYGLPTSTDRDLAETFGFVERVYDKVDAMTASAFALFEGPPFARGAANFGLAPGEPQVEASVAGLPIRSRRLAFRERTSDGDLRPPRGPLEVAEWHRRRRWLGDVPFLEELPCEHYLLHVAARRVAQEPPREPPRVAA